MRISAKNISTNPDYTIDIESDNGEKKLFDVKPFLDKGAFRQLTNLEIFRTAKVVDGAVEWNNSIDFSPDTLYLLSN